MVESVAMQLEKASRRSSAGGWPEGRRGLERNDWGLGVSGLGLGGDGSGQVLFSRCSCSIALMNQVDVADIKRAGIILCESHLGAEGAVGENDICKSLTSKKERAKSGSSD